jgi:Flp pilus assembly pilin Flp
MQAFSTDCQEKTLSVVFQCAGKILTNFGSLIMAGLWKEFLRDETGQDLIEYSLLLAFVALGSAGLFINAGRSVKGIWGVANTTLATANTTAS